MKGLSALVVRNTDTMPVFAQKEKIKMFNNNKRMKNMPKKFNNMNSNKIFQGNEP